MSHLRKHQNKQTIKRLLIFAVIVAVGAFAAFQLGLKSVINATLLLNNVLSGNTAQEHSSADENFFGTLSVDTPAHATNSAELFVSGSTSGYETLKFYINNTRVGEMTAEESFNKRIGKLKEGENSIYVAAEKGNNKKESPRFTVVYKNKPPTLEISTPKDGDTVSNQEIQLEGKTDPRVNVTVNNQHVVVDTQGNFRKSLRLQEGENSLTVVARDEAGNTEEASLTIQWQKDE